MYESDTERYAIRTPRAEMLRRLKLSVVLGIFMSASLLVCGVIACLQEASDRVN
jgi:hypothetical protein